MAYLVISVANFFYIFLHFCTIKYSKIWNMFCSGRTQLGCCSFFLNILWEGREMACFKMSFILHCTKIKFPKPGFTVDHSTLTFYVRWNVSVFLSLYMAFDDCFLMVLWFVLLVIFIKMFMTVNQCCLYCIVEHHDDQILWSYCNVNYFSSILGWGWITKPVTR